MAWPTDLNTLQKKEAVHFQRKMRAFRNLKNHLLTARLKELEEEAKQRNWGAIPEFIRVNRPKHYLTHLEVVYYYWPQPFEEVEKLWLRRHFKEFGPSWNVPDEDVLTSKLITPYMKFIRCYPHPALLQLREIYPPADKPTKSELGMPFTGKNLILDAKAVLTFYGMHRLKEWEVHDNIDYEMMDFQILLEELRETAKPIISKLKVNRATIRELMNKKKEMKSEENV